MLKPCHRSASSIWKPQGVLLCGALSARCRLAVVFDGVGSVAYYPCNQGDPMTADPEEIFEAPRLPTEAEVAEIVKTRREEHKWTQATLAEIAGLNERTIQRVENGEPSSPDTRRAIARAFECDDLDVFNKPMRRPNIEKLKAYWAELDKTTIIVPITRIQDARTLRMMSEAARGFAVDELGELSTEAREA